ncbi:hypothetical protein BZL29_7778 [Mycobacterium kansasii]|uniref:Mycothiol-dependent maleylpyruvate isomerase metal-binding domain-containing protein n=1 Tax=Mycobacterium kansasii TaxID=1768 RepID=A0A1V3WEY9_MYCKA|nr:hypothetical protein BZL29_7778 [Mycobacterium kansasii]
MDNPRQTPTARHVILITGGSRGVGAATARRLASPNTHVIITYREKTKRANDIVDSIAAEGGSATAARLDICDPIACADLIRSVRDEFGHLDALVLNASGGLERGASADYPMRINRDAPVHLLNRALPLIPAGGRVVFVTSHQAHFYGLKPVPADYIPIAQSKRAGEDALRAMRPELAARDVSLTVVSGDMIDGTIIVRLLQRRDPDAVEARRAHGPLPTLDEFAAAIAAAALNPTPADDTIYVGGDDYLELVNDAPSAHTVQPDDNSGPACMKHAVAHHYPTDRKTQMPFAQPTHFMQAATAVDHLLAHVTGDQWSGPTPCTGWTVADVTEHLIDVNHAFTNQLHPDSGAESPNPAGSPLPDRLASPDELLARYRASTDELRRALVSAVQPDGQLPKPLRTRLALRVADLVIHGWDIATSTGGSLRIDEHLVDEALAFAEARSAALQRGGQFASPQPISSNAPAIDRLAALSGRTRTSAATHGE